MTAVTIRPARAADAGALTALSMASKQSAGDYDAAFMAACADELLVTPAILAAHATWVAETDHPVGCVRLQIQSTKAEVHAFFVDPTCKRQGIGRTLWDVTHKAARAAGVTRIDLDADPTAVPFYEAMGFAVTGQSPSGSIPGRFLPRLSLALT